MTASLGIKQTDPLSLMTENIQPATDKEGFLVNIENWNESFAIVSAKQESIQLSDAHWEIITLLRRFYDQHQLSPPMRIFVKAVKEQLGEDKGNSIYLMQLFPGSPAKIASKIAGLPKPTNCL
jgi:tRNA 2-thiouridine synthesizing protein E